MTTSIPAKPICLPPAALNGGPLDSAPAKIGQWVWQPKIDDWRAVAHAPSGQVWNQYGERSSIADQGKLATALNHLEERSPIGAGPPGLEWFDIGIMQNRHDMMRGSIIVFDIMDTPLLTFAQRRAILEAMLPVMPLATLLVGRPGLANEQVYLIPQVIGEEAGRQLYRDLHAQNAALNRKFYEGVVCKKLSGLYPVSQRSKNKTAEWVKHRMDQG